MKWSTYRKEVSTRWRIVARDPNEHVEASPCPDRNHAGSARKGNKVDVLIAPGSRVKRKRVESSQYTTISNHNVSLPNQSSFVVNIEKVNKTNCWRSLQSFRVAVGQ